MASRTQIQDFNPGINPFPSGLFWTLAMSPDSVSTNIGQGTASMRATNLSVRDFGNIGNSLSNGPSVPGVVSFDVEWSGIAQRGTLSKSGFALNPFVSTGASISWTGTSSNGSFTSTAVTKVDFAELAHEINGVFFSG